MASFGNSRRRLHIKKRVSFGDQQHRSNLGHFDTFDGIPIVPENLPDISLKQPSRGAMRALIRSAYQDSQLSPTFIDDVMASLHNYIPPEDFPDSAGDDTYPTPPYSPLHETTTESPTIFEVTQIEHVPAENDIMAGALQTDETRLDEDFDDKTVCDKDIWKQFKYMKWRLLTAEDLAEIDDLFNDRSWCLHSLKEFGNGFRITNEGLRRSLEDCNGTVLEGWDRDMLVLGAISRRGGKLASKGIDSWPLFYPEDFKPVLDPGDDFLDIPYWEELYTQGRIWIESDKNLWPDKSE